MTIKSNTFIYIFILCCFLFSNATLLGQEIDLELSLMSTVYAPNTPTNTQWFLTVTNQGPDEATNIIIESYVPVQEMELVIDSVDYPLDSVYAITATQFSWFVSTLMAGESKTIELLPMFQGDGGIYENYAQVVAANEQDIDSTPNNLNGGPSEDDEGYAVIETWTDVEWGCTDSLACDYNPDATEDSGSCFYPVAGCACNDITGCTDPNAGNYNPNATCDDGSCEDIDLNPSVDCRFIPGLNNCENDQYCVHLQIKGNNGANFIGTSSIFMTYDETVLNFDSDNGMATVGTFTPLHFGGSSFINPDCNQILPPEPYGNQAFDGSTQGSINMTIEFLLSPFQDDPWDCYGIENVWTDVTEICFEVLDSLGNPNLQFESEFTSFNSQVNDGSNAYSNGIFESLTTIFSALCLDLEIAGCTDSLACEYDPTATIDDGSCGYPDFNCPCNAILGCTDPTSSNYDPSATCDDGTCDAPEGINFILNQDINGVISVVAVPSITLTGADAITASAQITLTFPSTGFEMSNFTSVNGTWSPSTMIESPVENPNSDYLFIGLVNLGTTDIDYVAGQEEVLFTFENSGACVDSIYLIKTSDPFYPPNSLSVNTINAIDVFGMSGTDNWSGLEHSIGFGCPIILGCTDTAACNYDSAATENDGSCEYGNTFCPNPCNVLLGCPGSMDPDSPYYNPAVTCIDPDCDPAPIILGCTDPAACNFNVTATENDGSCEYAVIVGCDCNAVLGCMGSMDPNSPNYNPAVTCIDPDCDPICTDTIACNFGNFGLCYYPDEGCTCDNPDCLLLEVWPGDANNDGIVNNFDVLNIGLAFDATGGARANASTQWEAQLSPSWNQSFDTGENYNHADCDGNGIVEQADVIAVTVNYAEVHGKTEASAADGFPIWVDVPEEELISGMTVEFPIHVGRVTEQLDNLYGLAFNVSFDEGLFVEESIEIDFSNSWLGVENQEMIALSKQLSANSIDIGASRITHDNISGDGELAIMRGIIDDIAGKQAFKSFSFTISNIKALDAEATDVPIAHNEVNEITVLNDANAIESISIENKLIDVYPNPSNGIVNIQFDNQLGIEGLPQNITFYDLDGKAIHQTEHVNNQNTVNTTKWNNGVYFIAIQYSEEIIWKKIVVD